MRRILHVYAHQFQADNFAKQKVEDTKDTINKYMAIGSIPAGPGFHEVYFYNVFEGADQNTSVAIWERVLMIMMTKTYPNARIKFC